VAVEDAGRGCVTAGLAGYGESSFCPRYVPMFILW